MTPKITVFTIFGKNDPKPEKIHEKVKKAQELYNYFGFMKFF